MERPESDTFGPDVSQGARKDRDSQPCCDERKNRVHVAGLVGHARLEAALSTGAGYEFAESRPELGRQSHEGIISEVAEADTVPRGQRVLEWQRDDGALGSDGFDDEVAVRDREQREANLDLPVGEGFDLFGRVEVAQIQGNIRMPRKKRGKNSSQDSVFRRGPEADGETADLAAGGLLRDPDGVFRVAEHMASFVQEQMAGLGQDDEVTCAVEQLHAEIALEVLNLMGEGRLGNMEPLRGASEM